VHGERPPCVHPPYCASPTPRWANLGSEPYPTGGRTAHRHATSPPLTSPHARPLVSACHPTRRNNPTTVISPSSWGPACQRTARVLRVTAAPTPSRVVHVAAEGGVQSKGGGGVRGAQRPACSGTVLGWVGVYSVTGCTAESSRAESGAWWWPCAHPFKRRLPSHVRR
jgi:hypothetical protein